MRSGLVLLELLLVLALTGLITLFAIPRVLAVADAAAVRDETMRMVTALEAARGASMRLGTVASLLLTDSAYRVTAVVAGDTVTAWRQPGPARSGVILSGAGAAVTFGPAGLAMGVANRSIVLSRGRVVRRVILSKLGRVTY